MMAGRWWRLAWAIAFFALAGTPAVRALCAATCDGSGAHASHAEPAGPAAPAGDAAQGSGHEHGHHHGAAAADEPGTAETRVTPDGARPCDDLTAAAVTGPRAGVVAAPPAALFAGALAPADRPRLPATAPAPPRPPGGAEAPLPLRI